MYPLFAEYRRAAGWTVMDPLRSELRFHSLTNKSEFIFHFYFVQQTQNKGCNLSCPPTLTITLSKFGIRP